MTVLERIQRLVEAVPPGTTVSLRVEALAEWIEEELGSAPTVTAEPHLDDLTLEQVAERVGRASSTVRGWLGRGELRGYKLNGRDWRVPRAALAEYLEAQRSSAVAATNETDLGSWRDCIPGRDEA